MTQTTTQQTLITAQAREMGREHGAAVPCTPADPEQARSDRSACRALRGASQEALDAYLEGHLQGQAGQSAHVVGAGNARVVVYLMVPGGRRLALQVLRLYRSAASRRERRAVGAHSARWAPLDHRGHIAPALRPRHVAAYLRQAA